MKKIVSMIEKVKVVYQILSWRFPIDEVDALFKNLVESWEKIY